MAQDVAKGRPTEIDAMNGWIAAKGREVGVPTPVSDAVIEAMPEAERGLNSLQLLKRGILLIMGRQGSDSDDQAWIDALTEAEVLKLRDALGGPAVAVKNGWLQLTVPPLFGRVLITK